MSTYIASKKQLFLIKSGKKLHLGNSGSRNKFDFTFIFIATRQQAPWARVPIVLHQAQPNWCGLLDQSSWVRGCTLETNWRRSSDPIYYHEPKWRVMVVQNWNAINGQYENWESSRHQQQSKTFLRRVITQF